MEQNSIQKHALAGSTQTTRKGISGSTLKMRAR